MIPKRLPKVIQKTKKNKNTQKSAKVLQTVPLELGSLIFDVQGLILELKLVTFRAQSSTFQSHKLALESQEHAQDAFSRC